MSELSATNCGCGNSMDNCGCGCGMSSCVWIILLLCCCGGWGRNGDGCGCEMTAACGSSFIHFIDRIPINNNPAAHLIKSFH